MVPENPTAKTSEEDLPQTARRESVVLLVIGLQVASSADTGDTGTINEHTDTGGGTECVKCATTNQGLVQHEYHNAFRGCLSMVGTVPATHTERAARRRPSALTHSCHTEEV